MTTATGLSEQKRTYLDVLAIAHYVYAALIAFIGLVMMLMASIGLFGFAGHRGPGMHMGSGVERGLAGCLPLAFIGLAFLVVFAVALVNFLVGRWLTQRRQWMPIIVVSVLNALNMPLGTLLGVFTIIVLVDDDVRAAFGRGGAPTAAPPATGREI
jgi:hypothetical protein